jgi:hypothetical protein
MKISKFEASYSFDFLLNTRNTYAKDFEKCYQKLHRGRVFLNM